MARTRIEDKSRPHKRFSSVVTVPILEDPGPYTTSTRTGGKRSLQRRDWRGYPFYAGMDVSINVSGSA